ncbi:MAG: Lrp/AsnC ligand binding domain-containing protein, partial [Pannonibacter indicus]
ATSERMKRLIREGYILRFTAELNPQKLNLGLLVFVEVKLDKTTADVFDAFASAVARSAEVLECHMVAGGFDYLIKSRVRDMTHYRQFLAEVILNLPGVRETHTYAVMEDVKDTHVLPI